MIEPKILVFDIETYGGLKAHMSEVSAFGYKWKGERAKVLSGMDFKKEFKSDFTNDKPLLKALSEQWNKADVVIAHYGEKFDRRFLNTRIEKHCLPPLKPVVLIDTWRIAKDNFALHSNKLDVLLQFFHSPYQKVNLTYEEWRQVMRGDLKACRKLNQHCLNDVLGLDWVVWKHLVHYTNKLPNYNLFVDPENPRCPDCGSRDLKKEGFNYTRIGKRQQYQCKKCFKWPQGPIGKRGIIR